MLCCLILWIRVEGHDINWTLQTTYYYDFYVFFYLKRFFCLKIYLIVVGMCCCVVTLLFSNQHRQNNSNIFNKNRLHNFGQFSPTLKYIMLFFLMKIINWLFKTFEESKLRDLNLYVITKKEILIHFYTCVLDGSGFHHMHYGRGGKQIIGKETISRIFWQSIFYIKHLYIHSGQNSNSHFQHGTK